jgi:hypothetical protein
MYRLFAPYWWGHRPIAWIHQYADFSPIAPPSLGVSLPANYTAVKFYFNDCFRNTPQNRAFVDRTIRCLADEGPVISLSTGVALAQPQTPGVPPPPQVWPAGQPPQVHLHQDSIPWHRFHSWAQRLPKPPAICRSPSHRCNTV